MLTVSSNAGGIKLLQLVIILMILELILLSNWRCWGWKRSGNATANEAGNEEASSTAILGIALGTEAGNAILGTTGDVLLTASSTYSNNSISTYGNYAPSNDPNLLL